MGKIIGFVRHLRAEYFRRRRHGLIYYAIIAALLVGAFGALRYFKVSPIPKIPVPGANAAQAVSAHALIVDSNTIRYGTVSGAYHVDNQR